jgi:hypothetical protein
MANSVNTVAFERLLMSADCLNNPHTSWWTFTINAVKYRVGQNMLDTFSELLYKKGSMR